MSLLFDAYEKELKNQPAILEANLTVCLSWYFFLLFLEGKGAST